MLKCAGHLFNPCGIDSTAEGECTVSCPACPQPGKNLLADLMQTPLGTDKL